MGLQANFELCFWFHYCFSNVSKSTGFDTEKCSNSGKEMNPVGNGATERSRKKYEELFPTDTEKALAFDKIAEKYYLANFGSTSKADIDVLMFSIYLEQILDISENDMESYSDYTLSKLLGITQSRISNLKVKKELQYPYANFSWKESFSRILDNYRYENGKIKLYIPDRNLYYEIKNVIENAGGYIEVQLNTSLLQINPEYFVDLLVAITDGSERKEIKKQLLKELCKHKVSEEEFNKKSIGDILKEKASDKIMDIVCGLIESSIPILGKQIGSALKRLKNDLTGKKEGK